MQCQYCGKELQSQRGLTTHTAMMHKDQPKLCMHCGVELTTENTRPFIIKWNRRTCIGCHNGLAATYRENHSEHINSYKRKYYQHNRAKHYASQKKWDAANRQERRVWLNQYAQERRANDIQYRLAYLVRMRLRDALNRSHVYKSQKTLDLLGCSAIFLKSYLESKFLPGMSWERRHEIHIDHIKPCDSFDLTDPGQLKACFHYTNLQPLWAKDNQRKSNKIIPTRQSNPHCVAENIAELNPAAGFAARPPLRAGGGFASRA